MDETRSRIDAWLISLLSPGVSDIHFKVRRPPLVRINGALRYNEQAPPLDVAGTESLARHLLGEAGWERLARTSEVDTSYSVPGHCRFRVAAFRQRGSISMVLRIIPFEPPTLETLGIPRVVERLACAPRGLVLVTGVTGSGKSSTLAAMVDYVNRTTPCHIITIEDPIEFLHRDNCACINQREIGVDTPSFASAFRAALRQDPDIILVGELRDLESMEIALRAAETGHLVLSTVHTTDARETIGRFIDAFPPHQHTQVRMQLAGNLRGIVSQRLLERADGQGRVAAVEVLMVNAAIRELIIDPSRGTMLDLMERGGEQYSMQTFDQALLELVRSGAVSVDEALANATSPNDFRLRLNLD